jgi:hypothetical protein
MHNEHQLTGAIVLSSTENNVDQNPVLELSDDIANASQETITKIGVVPRLLSYATTLYAFGVISEHPVSLIGRYIDKDSEVKKILGPKFIEFSASLNEAINLDIANIRQADSTGIH